MSESFNWNHPSLNKSHFHSLANLLSLRNGGQAEPSSLPDTLLEEEWDPDDAEDGYAPSVDTNFAHRLSESGHARLKRRFLDCLAEFAANRKGGLAVACSAMDEAEDNVVVWIARNAGFADEDSSVFSRLGELLGSLSNNSVHRAETLLWEEMVSYQRNRIENDSIPGLRASFKAYDASRARNNIETPSHGSVSDGILSVLRNLLFDPHLNNTGTLEKHTRLVVAAYNLRRTKDVEEELFRSPSATSKSKTLWVHICLLARLRVAFERFKDISLLLPSFAQVSITLVHHPLAPTNPPQCPLNLNQTFALLGLDPSPATTKAVLGQNWTVGKAKLEFAKRQKQKLNIHAEVQMLLFLNTSGSSPSLVRFPYFGCSKLSCFKCNRFLQSYGRFTTRGCHGRLFKPWTVPSVDRLLPGHSYRIARALLSLQHEVHKMLKASVEAHIPHERTSAVGGSSIFSGGQREQHSQRQLQVDRLRMKAERDRVAEIFRRRTDETVGSSMRTWSAPEGSEPEWDGDECDVCSRLTRRRCSLCNKGFFCSDSCQEKRTGSHLFTCSKRPLTSADYLWKSMAKDLMPQDEDVLEDFGFNNVVSAQDGSYLLGVYRGLYLSGRVSAEDIHDWRVSGILIDKIKEFYFGIPETSRGQYFPWLLRNLHVFERPMTKDEAQQKLIATFYDKARPYLDIEDRDKTARDLRPEAKGASYNLLAGMLLRMTPNPIDMNWYSFGFVTCRGHAEESSLVDLYQLLLTESDGSFFYEFHNRRRGFVAPATFTQFWKAYEAGTLIQLMDSKGLRELRSRLPFLEAFLSAPPVGPRESVWDLKQFLEIREPWDWPPAPSVDVDYGFVNCHTSEETYTPMEIYDTVLKTANPLELHRACVAGDLFRFASRHLQMEERWSSLMRNPYPLETGVKSGLRPEVNAEVDEDSGGLASLFSRLWGSIGGFANQ